MQKKEDTTVYIFQIVTPMMYLLVGRKSHLMGNMLKVYSSKGFIRFIHQLD